MVDDKYADEAKFTQLNAQIEADVLKYGELHKQVVSAHVLEELGRWNVEDNQITQGSPKRDVFS